MSLNPPARSIMMSLLSTSVNGRYELSFPPALIRAYAATSASATAPQSLSFLCAVTGRRLCTSGITRGRTLSADALLACRLSQHARGSPAGPFEQDDRGQDQGAAKVLDRIRAFAQDDDREQHRARRLERAQDRRARRSDETQSEDEGQHRDGGADHR